MMTTEDYDDFAMQADEYLDEPEQEQQSRRRRWLSGAVGAVGVVLFLAVVWYAYSQGKRIGSESTAPLIQADNTPIRVRPEQPGGLDVPNQDKLVYDRLDPGSQQAQQKVEQLLPPPETPVAHPAPAEPPAAPAANPPAQAAAPSAGPSIFGANGAGNNAAAAPAPPAAPPAPVRTAEMTPPAPPAAATAAEPPAAPAASAAALPPPATTGASNPAAQKPASAKATGGGFRVQLASVRSEEGARAQWKRLQEQHADVLQGLGSAIVKADLGDRGTFYRIQAGPIDGAKAQSICSTLKAQNVACIVVRP